MWTYRGYQLRASEFATAMAHLFRAEVNRANVWRTRLDTTTNWAVIATGATLSIAFSQTNAHHAVIILNTLLVSLFLYIEARRYQYYELWSARVRLMETDFFAAMLVPPFQPAPDWAETLAESLLHPRFPVSLLEAWGRRFRRNYSAIFFILGASWIAKIWLHPTAASDLGEFISRAAIGFVSGWAVLGAGLLYNGAMLALGLATAGLQQASGEVLPRFMDSSPEESADKRGAGEQKERAWFRPRRRRQQLIAFIITDKSKQIGKRILKEMQRGVTSLPGTGMYTKKPHTVLMCAVTVTEVPRLKAIIKDEDPEAFSVVSPAHEIFGKGFMSLAEKESS